MQSNDEVPDYSQLTPDWDPSLASIVPSLPAQPCEFIENQPQYVAKQFRGGLAYVLQTHLNGFLREPDSVVNQSNIALRKEAARFGAMSHYSTAAALLQINDATSRGLEPPDRDALQREGTLGRMFDDALSSRERIIYWNKIFARRFPKPTGLFSGRKLRIWELQHSKVFRAFEVGIASLFAPRKESFSGRGSQKQVELFLDEILKKLMNQLAHHEEPELTLESVLHLFDLCFERKG